MVASIRYLVFAIVPLAALAKNQTLVSANAFPCLMLYLRLRLRHFSPDVVDHYHQLVSVALCFLIHASLYLVAQYSPVNEALIAF